MDNVSTKKEIGLQDYIILNPCKQRNELIDTLPGPYAPVRDYSEALNLTLNYLKSSHLFLCTFRNYYSQYSEDALSIQLIFNCKFTFES